MACPFRSSTNGLLKGAWRAPKDGKWRVVKGVSTIFEPLACAYDPSVWDLEDLDKIANAMQAWRGPGHCDDLTGGRLRDHMYRMKPAGVAPPKMRVGPPRCWRT